MANGQIDIIGLNLSFREYPRIYLKIDLCEGGCVSKSIPVDSYRNLLEIFHGDDGMDGDNGILLQQISKKYVRCVFDDPDIHRGKIVGIGHIVKDKWMLF